MKPGIEQVGKDGLPPLLRHVGAKSASGGKPPFLTCSFPSVSLARVSAVNWLVIFNRRERRDAEKRRGAEVSSQL